VWKAREIAEEAVNHGLSANDALEELIGVMMEVDDNMKARMQTNIKE